MIDIAFINETEHESNKFEELIGKVFEQTFKTQGIDKYYEVSVVFVSKERIQQINKDYRNIDKVTDVISFALLDSDDEIVEKELITTLGDIFICIDKAILQAEDYGHSLEREIGFLACHGLLHLLGFDHNNEEDEIKMFTKQDDILNSINLKRVSE
ncbi:MAG: rRNA maturation RNase YbeY [Haloplasmataceae bacterium]|nr:rRNA maturation RNase YbeY [Haloplasmataceae bacterium]